MIYSSWDIEHDRLKLIILGHFFPFTSQKTQKIKILKTQKNCWRYHYFTHLYQKSQSYDVRFLRYRVSHFFVILGHFLTFYPLDNLENQNFEKLKKVPGDIVILHMCTISNNHMMYGHFGPFFAHLPPPYNPEHQNFERKKKQKTPGDIKQTDFFVILGYFCPFTPPPNNPENQKF